MTPGLYPLSSLKEVPMKRKVQRTVLVLSLVLLTASPATSEGPPNPTPSDAAGNTAGGTNALINNTTGFSNTAFGGDALHFNTTGAGNTASGARALFSNTTGVNNTASGVNALVS